MSLLRFDVVVVGGGIVGMATALRLTERHPRLQVAVLEKEAEVGVHQTGHNSGVIHSGIYYPPGSLKARLCIAGSEMMKAFCRREGIPYHACGKVVVAVEERELPALKDLYRRARENGVPGVELIGPERLAAIEPHVRGRMALYSPGTAVVDFQAVIRRYAKKIQDQGGTILLRQEVFAIRNRGSAVRLETTKGIVEAGYVVTCTGLQADRTLRAQGLYDDLRVVPFRGSYWLLRPQRAHLIKGCVYPVPDRRLPFLGVHFTPRWKDGGVLVGPNAVLALAREKYQRVAYDRRDTGDLLLWPGTWRVAGRFFGYGLGQVYRDLFRGAFADHARRYLPALKAGDLLPGPTGIRAQMVSRDGRLTDDFRVRKEGRVLHVQNAPSPAATASLALADHILSVSAIPGEGVSSFEHSRRIR